MKRPEYFDMAIDILEEPEAQIIIAYVEVLEAALQAANAVIQGYAGDPPRAPWGLYKAALKSLEAQ